MGSGASTSLPDVGKMSPEEKEALYERMTDLARESEGKYDANSEEMKIYHQLKQEHDDKVAVEGQQQASGEAPPLAEEKASQVVEAAAGVEGQDQPQPAPAQEPPQETKRKETADKSEEPDYMSTESDKLFVGDVVSVQDPHGPMWFEGLLISIETAGSYTVQLDDGIVKVEQGQIRRVHPWSVLEIEDIVMAKPPGEHMFFRGKITAIDSDHHFSVLLEGDDPSDVITGIHGADVKKVSTARTNAAQLWKTALVKVVSVNRLNRFGLLPVATQA